MSATYGLERYRDAMLATAAILYPPPPEPAVPMRKPLRRPRAPRLPRRSKMIILSAPRGYMFIGPYAVPVGSTVSILEIQTKVAQHYRIPPAEMISKRQGHEVSHPRQVAMYLAKQLTPRSLPEIGRRFGGRDHTTVIHAIRAVEHRRALHPELDQDIRAIRSRLRGGA